LNPRGKEFPELSPRELQLLQLAMAGNTDASIACQLDISEATVSTYWGRIRIKLGPHSRTELVAIYLREENAAMLEQLRRENERLGLRVSEDGESLCHEIIECAPDAIIVVQEEGQIELVNEQAAVLFGYEKEEMIGKPISMLVPKRYRVVHKAHRERYLANPEKRRMGEHMTTVALRKDGTEFLIAASLNTVKSSGGRLVVCVVREAVRAQTLECEDV
jgi:PAS domain S-box-containing protein